ncbi:MAG: ATP-dependent DNA helicase RecQ [uncultured Thermomicrobiales bacterium]|uniref:ATP-dependent DNA helicase RecQ n=1 Tax=uncultured Thermomicrobiales bacterium TaxID=1645740 RepID=A0A6J4VXK4_9BACT|nr:MAG: ATP-dependent DNA helicase RecQ [uncultured Thermomicrobiales bacterium]
MVLVADREYWESIVSRREKECAIVRVARESFGYAAFRPGQEEAIEATLAGRDSLVILPTGAGKSAIYQIAALLLDGPTVVVSPLIALQRDQVESLEGRGEAAEINSTHSPEERATALADAARGKVEFLFLAPEQFANAETRDRLRAARPSLFVVDEAHCVSEWGHDFRPDYLRLGAIIEELGHPTVLALTATASPPVRDEIIARLGLRDARTIVRGFDRPNIAFGVERHETAERQRRALIERVVAAEKPGIVYAATRRDTEEIAATLQQRGVRAAPYHAGLRPPERGETQDSFGRDEIEVVVATVAFGLGIDKPNVRFVFHAAISDAIDSYYQEIGRAGRDGDPARAILFYRQEDLGLRRFFAGGGQVDADQIEQVARAVQDHDQPADPRDLRDETGLSQSKLTTALSRLEEVGAVALGPSGTVTAVDLPDDPTDVAREAAQAQAHHKEFECSRLEMMRGYAELRGCRREYLLNYFGEEYAGPCGRCDNCVAGVVEAEGEQPFPISARVRHRSLGEGLVMRYEGDKIVVLFDEVGYKTLALSIVTGEGLLEAA